MSDDDLDSLSREQSPCSDSPQPALLEIENPLDMCTSVSTSTNRNPTSAKPHMKVNASIKKYFFPLLTFIRNFLFR